MTFDDLIKRFQDCRITQRGKLPAISLQIMKNKNKHLNLKLWINWNLYTICSQFSRVSATWVLFQIWPAFQIGKFLIFSSGWYNNFWFEVHELPSKNAGMFQNRHTFTKFNWFILCNIYVNKKRGRSIHPDCSDSSASVVCINPTFVFSFSLVSFVECEHNLLYMLYVLIPFGCIRFGTIHPV